jgi:hypothetical protein
VFDTVGKLGWFVDVRTHPIKAIITRLLEDEEVDWGDDDDDDGTDNLDWWTRFRRKLSWGKKDGEHDLFGEKRRDVPKATIEGDCVVSNIFVCYWSSY